MKTRVIFILFIAVAFTSQAQFRDFDNFELQYGFKGFKVDAGNVYFRHDTVIPDTSFVLGNGKIGAPEIMNLLSIGYEAQVYDNIFVSAKTDFNIGGRGVSRIAGMGVQLGAGYRYKLNYFMRLQGEFLLSWGVVTDTMGSTSSYNPRPLTLSGIQFVDTASLTTFYRGQQYGFQPKVSLVAEFSPRLELRFTMMYQIALVYNQSVVLEGLVGPNQTERVNLPFRNENTNVTFNDLPLEKPLYRPSGFSARAGLAFKIIR
ncbi:MAG: hypothetical protein ACPGLV_00920 [Bacteroidia bacterium]